MLAFVLLFAVAFSAVTAPTKEQCNFEGATWDETGKKCKCETEKNIIVTEAEGAVTYKCAECQAPNDKYDTTGMRCYKEATCNLPGQKVNMDKCECTVEGYKENTVESEKETKPCVCNTGYHQETSGTTKVCKADAVCTLPGQQPNENKNACECTVDGFEKDETASTEAELKCKCAEANKYIINKTGTTNVLSYACEVCGEGQTYNAQKMSCETPAPTCNLPGQQAKGGNSGCECDTEKGFTANTGEDKDTKPCVCGTTGNNIIKETGNNNAVTYKCAKCEGETPEYDSTNMKCYKKEQTEEEKCKGVKGQEWKDNQCVCDTANGFENKETGKEKPINCGCKEAGHNIIKETKDNTTSYKCAKCEDKEKYDENEMKCIKSGVNGLFLLLAMALFFLF